MFGFDEVGKNPSITPSGVYVGNRHRIKVEPQTDSLDMLETWPTYMSVLPNVGDFIESDRGRKLQVMTLTHTRDDKGVSLVIIEVGPQKSTDITPTEGGPIAENII